MHNLKSRGLMVLMVLEFNYAINAYVPPQKL